MTASDAREYRTIGVDDRYYSVEEIAKIAAVRPKSVRQVLWKHRERFSEAFYRGRKRLLPREQAEFVLSLFRVRVKKVEVGNGGR